MPGSHTFRPRHRLCLANDFRAAYDAKLSKVAGPLIVFGRPNDLPEHRLGLAVGRATGNAVARHRIKRMLREAFRLGRPGWPLARPEPACGFDLVIRVRPHDRADLVQYQRWLGDAVARIAREHQKRAERAARQPDPEAGHA